MIYKDLFELTVQRFKIRLMRVLLTMVGIGIGIGIVFFLVSLGFGLQELVIGKLATSDSLLALEISSNSSADALKINRENIDKIMEQEGTEEYSPLLSIEMMVRYDGLISQTSTQGVKNNYFRLAGLEDITGEVFSDDVADKVVVTSSLLVLFDIPESEAIGKTLTLSNLESGEDLQKGTSIENDIDVQISGIITDPSNGVFINIKNFKDFEKQNYNNVRVKVANKDLVEPVKEEVQKMGFQVTALTDTLDQLNKVFNATQVMFAAFGVVALFISAVGMFNTMTISLLERTREIGIMKAIGARKGDIWQMFLAEALIIGLLGGVVGLLLGWLSTNLVNFILNRLANSFGGESVDLFYAPSWFILTILGFSLIVGFMTGLFPAKRASGINALQALRYE